MPKIECPMEDCGSINVVCVDKTFALFRCSECGAVFDEADELPMVPMHGRDDYDDE